MIKIVHVITCLGQGGAETMLYNLLMQMDKTKFENNVISMMDEGVFGERIKMVGIPLYCLRMQQGRLSAVQFWHYCRLIKSMQPHIVQAWMYHANFLAMIARPFLPAHQIIFNIRSGLDGLKKEKTLTHLMVKFNAWLSRFAARVINNSTVSQAQHARIGFAKRNGTYIGNGFDTERFKPSSTIYNEFRKGRQYKEDIKIVAMFARFHPIKNHRGFLEMAEILKATYSGNIIYLMGGVNVNDNNRELLACIQSLGLTGQVLLVGSVDVANYLPAVDVLVLPSFGEGFSNIVGEAMACGVPCVATNVGDTQHIIANLGYVNRVNDVAGLAKSVIKILSLSPTAYQRLSNHCVEHIRQKYSIQQITRQYETVYSQVAQ